jgi:hypothetical protein
MMKIISIVTLVLIVSSVHVAGGGTDAEAESRISQKHELSLQKAADAYWRLKITADREYRDALAKLYTPETAKDQAFVNEYGTAMETVDYDIASLKAHASVLTQAQVDQQIADSKLPPDIASGIANHSLVLGMTVQQGNRALGTPGRQVAADAVGQTIEWTVTHTEPYLGRQRETNDPEKNYLIAKDAAVNDLKKVVTDSVFDARIENGKIVSFTKQ